MKKLFGKIIFGVAIGCFGFVAMLFIASAFSGGANTFIGQWTGEELLRIAACFIIISVGYSVPSLVYEKENLAISLRVLIHMIAGTIVYLLTAYFAGWIGKGFKDVIVYILIALGIAAVFWGFFMLAFRMQVDKINRRIKDKNQA